MAEPKIVALLCNWCSYAASDLAGVSRYQYPPSVRIIRVMCSSRVDPAFVLEALAMGIDGVLVCGCHPGDCHYITGNLKEEERINMTRELLEVAGVNSKRLRLKWVAASEGKKFQEVVTEFTEEIKKLKGD